jgi:hypothetical protein
MARQSRILRDDLLEEAHNTWLEQVADSGLPLYLTELYSFSPLCIPLSIDENTPRLEEVEKTPDIGDNQDLPF